MNETLKLGFLASHSGSSMRAIVQAIADGVLRAEARIVISNNGDSAALAFARDHGIAARHISGRTAGSAEAADRAIADALTGAGVTLLILSGYLRPVGPETLTRFSGRILNIHPALLPAYGGQGMYGGRVHAAVIASGETETGCSIHLVDGEYDHGQVISQRRVQVEPADTPETLAARVMAVEPGLFVETLREIATRGSVLPAP
ncbi:MAG: phosphoribosylglycinamide formyltransferase [Caulobacterales bacterium]|nr:phosphoribosylglycinamide formyltransferase [Caulobacterales bacterium]